MNRQIVLKSRPLGMPSIDNFEISNIEEPSFNEGEIIVKAKYISVDPYMRGRMNETKSYLPSFEIGKPIEGGVVAEVAESRHPDYKPGDAVMGMLSWKVKQAVNVNNINKLEKSSFPLSHYLGILGMPGLTAYFGLLDIGKPKKDETFVVSGAAGAVGMVAGQLARLHGCRVVGIAGSNDKITFLREKLNFDHAINYKTELNLSQAIAEACPNGVDIYFDNVGGEISDAVLENINLFSRILVCGQISIYNIQEVSVGPRVQPLLLSKSALMQGFSVRNYTCQYGTAMKDMVQWIKDGKLFYEETVYKGFEKLPDAFVALFTGKNMGKLLVEVI